MAPQHKPTLKVMTDYHCWPLWISDGQDLWNPHPEELQFPAQLSEALIGWADQFDNILNQDDPASSDFESHEQEVAFVTLGLQLARKVKLRVGEQYQVFYYDVQQRKFVEILLEED
ncbi:hypothetical protein [Deinococcus roseus]|uniref:Uncharacterized protein n=1 Tax=Deinococcus roseus TaxID=392414 RepID=A0ABQ2CYA9_9DEIO|nr:hypothetical protein [Deinococcus roseus]GGJ21683.1 hypothetical protein GCM10008938_04860 [Deinococcus roseus]